MGTTVGRDRWSHRVASRRKAESSSSSLRQTRHHTSTMIVGVVLTLGLLASTHANDDAVQLDAVKDQYPAEFNGDEEADRSPWQPRTPPLSLLRLLGMRQSVPPHRGPLPPDVPPPPGVAPPRNLDKTNRSSSSSLSSSFLAGFSPPHVVADDRPLPEVGGRRETGSDARRAASDDELVERRPEAAAAPAVRLPQLQITPGGRRLRPASRDRDVTATDDDVTDATKTGNATDERRGDDDSSTVSRATTSMTAPLSTSDDVDNVTAAPELAAAGKDDFVEQPEVGSDNNKTRGGNPFHAIDRQPLPAWPAVPQDHLTLYQPAQHPFGRPSFGRPPGPRPVYGSPSDVVQGPPAVQSVDVPSVSGHDPPGWSEVDVDGPASEPPVNQARPDVRTSWSGDVERGGVYDERLSVEEEPTTWTTTSQAGTTSSDVEVADTAVLSESYLDPQRNHPSTRRKSTTTSTRTVESIVGGRTERGRSSLWGAASWIRSSSAALSATSFHFLLGAALLIHLAIVPCTT